MSVNKAFTILFLCLIMSPLFAQSDIRIGYEPIQSPIDTFVRTVTQAGELTASAQTADGGYVTTSRIDETTFLVRRIQDSGVKRWERILKFAVDADIPARLFAISQTTDGGFVLSGELGKESFSGLERATAIVIKLHPDGRVGWKKSLHLDNDDLSRFTSVIATSDGGAIAIGQTVRFDNERTRFLAFKFSATGNVIWKVGFNSVTDSLGFIYGSSPRVAVVTDGVIVADNSEARGVDLTKISNSGIIQWRRSVTSRDYFFRSIAATRDNGIIVVGTSMESNKLKIVKLKANGTLDWRAAYSFPVSIIISLSNPIQTVDGNYVFSGTINLPKDKYYGFIVNIGSSRRVVFQYVFRSAPSPLYIQRSSGRSVFAAKDGGFVLFDTGTETELIIIKMNSEGILPGCGFLKTLNPIQRIPFGVLKNEKSVFDYSELILEPKNFGLRSLASNQPESSVCK